MEPRNIAIEASAEENKAKTSGAENKSLNEKKENKQLSDERNVIPSPLTEASRKQLTAELGKKPYYEILNGMIATGFNDTKMIRSLFFLVNANKLNGTAVREEQIANAWLYILNKYKTNNEFPSMLIRENPFPFTREECSKLLLTIDKEAEPLPETISVELKTVPASSAPVGKFFTKDEKNFLHFTKITFKGHVHELETTKKIPKIKSPKKEEITTSQRNDKTWIVKKLMEGESKNNLFKECIAQELIRMLLDPSPLNAPIQPKTRILQMLDGSMCLISERVDFNPISKVNVSSFRINIKEGTFTGIGLVCAVSYITADSDRHGYNIGYNKNYKLVTIDGGHSFKTGAGFEVKAEVIQALPFIKKDSSYTPQNYFNLINHNKESKVSVRDEKNSLVTEDMAFYKSIRHEINQTFLKFIVLPDTLITDFVASYTDNPDLIKSSSNYLINRKSQFICEALKVNDFRKYILSSQSKNELKEYVKSLGQFKTMNKNYILGYPTDPNKVNSIFEMYDKAVEFAQVTEKELIDALHAAVEKSDIELVNKLLAANADPSGKNSKGKTLLHSLAERNDPRDMAIIIALIEAKANLETKEDDNTPLCKAVTNRFPEMVKALLKAKANFEEGYNNIPLLNLAAQAPYNMKIVEYLLEAKANPNVARENGETSLHAALRFGYNNTETIKVLLYYKANPNTSKINGESPLYAVAKKGNYPLLVYLLDAKADINAKNRDGATPLHRAIDQGDGRVATLLLKYKADFTIKTNDGLLPLDYAKGLGYQDIADVIEEAMNKALQETIENEPKKALGPG